MDYIRQERELAESSPRWGVLGLIFSNGQLAKLERFHRVAQCRSLVQGMQPVGGSQQWNESLANLRRLIRAEYRDALEDLSTAQAPTDGCGARKGGL